MTRLLIRLGLEWAIHRALRNGRVGLLIETPNKKQVESVCINVLHRAIALLDVDRSAIGEWHRRMGKTAIDVLKEMRSSDAVPLLIEDDRISC